MNEELIEELNYEISLLVGSGFYDSSEVLEIIEEQFMEEELSIDKVNDIILAKYDEKLAKEERYEKPTDFDRLKIAFDEITKLKIISIHNAGYSIDEGVQDAFEIFHYLKTKNMDSEGFCFYNFQDIEIAIEENLLNIAFGDFEGNEEKSLEVGKEVANILKNNGFSINWDEDVNTRIEIKPFKWEKSFDNEEYEMEGAFNSFLSING